MIIVSGDSFTDPNFKSQTNPDLVMNNKKWPDYISYGTIINVGKSGADNVSMINAAIRQINDNRKIVSNVIIGLSNWYRFALPHGVVNPDWSYNFNTAEKEKEFNENPYMKWLINSDYYDDNYKFNVGYCKEYNWWVSNDDVIEYSVEQTLFAIFNLYQICKLNNIQLHVFQMIYPIVNREETTHKFISALLKNKWFKRISKADINLIGWPFFNDIGGKCAEELLTSIDYKISNIDSHPNEMGHEVIGKWINENTNL